MIILVYFLFVLLIDEGGLISSFLMKSSRPSFLFLIGYSFVDWIINWEGCIGWFSNRFHSYLAQFDTWKVICMKFEGNVGFDVVVYLWWAKLKLLWDVEHLLGFIFEFRRFLFFYFLADLAVSYIRNSLIDWFGKNRSIDSKIGLPFSSRVWNNFFSTYWLFGWGFWLSHYFLRRSWRLKAF